MKNLVILFFSVSVIALSQPSNPEWINYTQSNTALDICEDGNFLWLCTHGGLVKFNKSTNQSEFFNKGNSLLPSNCVYSIVTDDEGYKWACTKLGLAKFKDTIWTVYNSANSGLPESGIYSIAIDQNNVKWIGTLDSGLVSFNGTSWTRYTTANSPLPSNKIRPLKFKNNTLWIGTSQGLVKKNDNGFSFITSTADKFISTIDIDINNNAWFGGWTMSKDDLSSAGLYKLVNDNLVQFFSYSVNFIKIDSHNVKWFGAQHAFPDIKRLYTVDSAETNVLPADNINSLVPYPWFYSLYVENNGTKYFGSASGLLKVDPGGSYNIFQTSNSALGREFVQKMFIDKYDNKWFFAYGSIPLSTSVLPPGYLTRLSGNTWTEFNSQNSPVTIGGVRAMANGGSSRRYAALYDIWGGTPLYKIENNVWTSITVPQTQYNTILYMWYDESTANLWVDFEGANYQNNVFRYSGFQWYPVNEYPVYDINKMERRGSNLWFASPQGLIKYNGSSYVWYNTSNSGLPDSYVSSIDFDSYGNLWIGTNNGLAKFDGTNWTVYNDLNSPLTCDRITGVVVDNDDNVFMGTESIYYPPPIPLTGMVRFDGSNWRFYNSRNSGKPDDPYSGFPDYSSYHREDINDISIDASGKIWIALNGGAGVYNKNGIPVPVELISFTASADGNNVFLKWTTATEINNAGFEIQKYSQDAWNVIGFIKGESNSTEYKEYSFADKNLQTGFYKYRLKQIDHDGTYTITAEKEIIIGSPGEFRLYQNYPNPFNPSTKIKYSIASGSLTIISITDILGNQVSVPVNEFKEAGDYEINFDGSNLPSGAYFFSIRSGNYFNVKKMMIIK